MGGSVLEQETLLPARAGTASRACTRRRSTCPTCRGARRSAAGRSGRGGDASPGAAGERSCGPRRSTGDASDESSVSSAAASICGDRLGDVEGVARHIAGVGDLLRGERMDVESGVVRAEEPDWHADRVRTEPCSRAVRHAAVERDPEDGDVADVDVLAPGEPGERRRAGESRDDERIDGPTGAGRPAVVWRFAIIGHRAADASRPRGRPASPPSDAGPRRGTRAAAPGWLAPPPSRRGRCRDSVSVVPP